MSKIGNYVVGGEEDGTLHFNEEERCYEEVDGNVQVTVEQKIINCQNVIDDLISFNGKKGKSKFGFINADGRRSLKRISKLLNEIGDSNGNR